MQMKNTLDELRVSGDFCSQTAYFFILAIERWIKEEQFKREIVSIEWLVDYISFDQTQEEYLKPLDTALLSMRHGFSETMVFQIIAIAEPILMERYQLTLPKKLLGYF
jgi:hypothetical protein